MGGELQLLLVGAEMGAIAAAVGSVCHVDGLVATVVAVLIAVAVILVIISAVAPAAAVTRLDPPPEGLVCEVSAALVPPAVVWSS